MTGWRKRTIMEMAQEAGMTGLESSELLENFEAFAKLVREDEREACAKVCESEWSTTQEHIHGLMLADKIQARGQA